MKLISVAIDGPSAAGKSTIAKIVATKLSLTYIDTGAMYRAFTWYVLEKNIDPNNEVDCTSVIPNVHIHLNKDGKVFCNKIDVTKEIRGLEVTKHVSVVSSYRAIRLALVELQREMAKKDSVIMDGRDIGTYVLPSADVKIFLVASVETRAIRRYKENIEKGIECDLEFIKKDIERRDKFDSSRSFAPLKQAEDAILLDTSDLNIEQVVERIIAIIEKKVK